MSYIDFFTEEVKKAKGKGCMNCGRRLSGHVSEIAHILPKSIFKSVATNPDAVLHLCSSFVYGHGGCHDLYDSSWEVAKNMKIWSIALGKFKLFEPEIKETNRKIINNFK